MNAQVGVLLASMQLMIFMWEDRSSCRSREETLDAGESIDLSCASWYRMAVLLVNGNRKDDAKLAVH